MLLVSAPYNTERKIIMRRIITVAIACVLLVLTTYNAIATNTDTNDTKSQIFDLLNDERVDAGLNKIKYLDDIEYMADTRAEELFDLFSHDRPDGSKYSTVYDDDTDHWYYATGEILARGYTDIDELITAWMDSPGHKDVILTDYFRYMSVGYYYSDESDTTFYSVIFCSRVKL